MNFGKNKIKPNITEIIEQFGKNFSYEQVMAFLPSFSSTEQKIIINNIYRKQQDFWDNPNIVTYYSKIYPNSPFVPNHFTRLIELLSVKNNEVIVDLGCGCGVLINEIFKKNKYKDLKIIGIDYSARALKKTSELNSRYLENGRLRLIKHDLKRGIPLPNESVDKIVSNWGIFYLHREDLKGALLEVNRVLKLNGIFICTAVIKGNILSLFQKKVIKEALKDFLGKDLKTIMDILREGLKTQKNLHFLFPMYSEKEILNMLEEAKFKIISKEYSLLGASIDCLTQKIESF